MIDVVTNHSERRIIDEIDDDELVVTLESVSVYRTDKCVEMVVILIYVKCCILLSFSRSYLRYGRFFGCEKVSYGKVSPNWLTANWSLVRSWIPSV